MATAEKITLSLKPEWNYIRPVREFVKELIFIKGGKKENADDIAFIINELLENAVKNANNKRITIECVIDDNVTEVKVSNRIPLDQYEVVKARFRAMCTSDTYKLYNKKFKEKSFWEDDKGAIGLIMVNERCEGRIKMDYVHLSIVMTCTVPIKELS